MAIIDAALVLVDGKGGTNVLDMGKPTTGGHNNLNGYVNVKTSGTQGSVKIQESDDNSSYSDLAGGTATFAAAGTACFDLPKTTKRYLKAVFTSAAGDNLSSSNTTVYIGGINYAKELA